MYDAYQAYADFSDHIRLAAANNERILSFWGAMQFASPIRCLHACHELVALAGFTHKRPDYSIKAVTTDAGETIPVTEEVVAGTPFCDLLRFSRQGASGDPRVLLVAPMSGHFATLLRGTIGVMVRDHDVYVTDWRNPRDIPLEHGPFGFEDFVQHIIGFLEFMGPESHLVAVCQPAVPALAAVALMAQDNDLNQPASMTLMAGPIDARISPTKVNEFATSKPIEWFREKMISEVPRGLPGAGRKVYPGFMQLSAFMSMNMDRHRNAFADLLRRRIEGDHAKADQIRAFYKEYFAIMDLDADFYLHTIETVFQKYALPEGNLLFRGRKIEPRAIKKTFLLTVEGEKDDICALGQTLAAQDLCSGLRPYMKSHHMQAGVGHYGVFNGRRWENHIYPVLREHIRSSM
jgi:polyhydroxyalkanoate depolymerase